MSDKIVIIRGIKFLNPTEYQLMDLRNENIDGKIYDQELQKTNIQQIFTEKILRKKNDMFFVKFRGYNENFNLWIPNSAIQVSDKEKYIDIDPSFFHNNYKDNIIPRLKFEI